MAVKISRALFALIWGFWATFRTFRKVLVAVRYSKLTVGVKLEFRYRRSFPPPEDTMHWLPPQRVGMEKKEKTVVTKVTDEL